MLREHTNKPTYKILFIIMALIVGLAAFSGCTATRGAVARGWAGGVVDGDIMYIATMTGNMVTLDLTDGEMIQSIPLVKTESSGGFLSCGAGTSSAIIYGSPVIAGNLVCIGGNSNTNKIYAFTTEETREEPRWVYPRDEGLSGSVIGSVVYDEGKLYFATADYDIYALDAEDGYKEWATKVDDMIWSTPAISGDTLYIGSFSKKLFALDKANGDIKWEYETGGAIVSPPVVDGDMVYVGSFDRNIYALDKDTGDMNWSFSADNWFWAKPVVYGDTLFAPCLDGKVYALNKDTGEKIAEYDLDNPISSSPVMIGTDLIVATQEGKVYTIDAAGNDRDVLTVLGENEKIFADLIIGDGKVYIHSDLDKLYEVDTQTGAKRELTIAVETEEDSESED